MLQDGPSVNRMSTKTDLSQLSMTELAYPLVSLNELPARVKKKKKMKTAIVKEDPSLNNGWLSNRRII